MLERLQYRKFPQHPTVLPPQPKNAKEIIATYGDAKSLTCKKSTCGYFFDKSDVNSFIRLQDSTHGAQKLTTATLLRSADINSWKFSADSIMRKLVSAISCCKLLGI